MRVGARDSRHVAERAAGVRERLVPLDSSGARLVDDDVREHVRDVARERDELVGARLDRMEARARPRSRGRGRSAEARLGRRRRSRRALEGPDDAWVAPWPPCWIGPADEPRGAPCCGDDVRLGRARVGDGRLVRARLEHRRDLLGEHGHRSGHDCEVGPGHRLGQRAGSLDRSALGRLGERDGVRVPAEDSGPGRASVQADGGADQPGADDGEPLDRHRYPRRMSSAIRKARSSDWRPFERGSQSVS
jgi:hypothetical protein